MRLGLPLLCLVVLTLLTQQARADDSLRWRQSDCAVGEACEEEDTTEYRILVGLGYGTTDWLEVTDPWLAGEVHGGTIVDVPEGGHVEMRTWRSVFWEGEWEDVMSESGPIPAILYVPEPSLLLGLGVGCLFLLARSRGQK